MKKMRVVSLLVGLLSWDLGAMQRAQSLMRVAGTPLVQQSSGTHVYSIDFAKQVRALLQAVQCDPHIPFGDWKKALPLIHSAVLQKINILDLSQIPIALDISNALAHELAPEHLKKQNLLTNYTTTSRVPSLHPQAHDAKLYQKVVSSGDWSQSPYFPRKALEMNPHELRQFVNTVSSKVCRVPCLACEESGKERVQDALKIYKSLMNET